MKRTRQGVPDLNGPAGNGRGYNGARGKRADCSHVFVADYCMRACSHDDEDPDRYYEQCIACGYRR